MKGGCKQELKQLGAKRETRNTERAGGPGIEGSARDAARLCEGIEAERSATRDSKIDNGRDNGKRDEQQERQQPR